MHGSFWWESLRERALGRSRVRRASNTEIDDEKKESEVRINLMCSGQRLMWAYMQGNDGLCSVQYGVCLE